MRGAGGDTRVGVDQARTGSGEQQQGGGEYQSEEYVVCADMYNMDKIRYSCIRMLIHSHTTYRTSIVRLHRA